jgi:hypothetical protein
MSETPATPGGKDEPEQAAETAEAPPERTVQSHETSEASEPASLAPTHGPQ